MSKLLRYPAIAELAYGHERRGCFENPSNNRQPKDGIQCPDIVPVEYEDREGYPNSLAMKNPSSLVRMYYFRIGLLQEKKQ